MHSAADPESAEYHAPIDRFVSGSPLLEGKFFIKKFKVGDPARIVVLSDIGTPTEKETRITIKEDLHPDVYHLLNALLPFVREVLMLPEDYPKPTSYDPDASECSIRISGVNWSLHEETEIKGIIITAVVVLATSNSPLIVNTPHLPFEPYSLTSPNTPCFPKEGQKVLKRLEEEIQRIMSGKRAQGGLFDTFPPEAKAAATSIRNKIKKGELSIELPNGEKINKDTIGKRVH
jgi:hypothetical protein